MIINFIDYIDIIGGGTPKTNVIEYWNGDVPWLSIDDFKECNYYVYSTNKFITNLGLKNSTTNLLHKNDIIISARGTVGKIALIYKDMAFNQSCFGLRVKRSKCSELNPVFLFYYLKANLKYLLKVKHDSIFDTINLENFKYIKLNLPPKYIQDKIADILSNIDNQIKRNDTMIERLQDLGNTIYCKTFKDCKDYISLYDYPYLKLLKPGINYFNNEKTYIPTAEVNNNIINLNSSKITFDNRESRANMQPVYNSIWFAKMKNSNKHIYLTEKDKFVVENFIFSTGFCGLECEDFAFEYLIGTLGLPYFEETKDKLSHGATMESINNDDLKSLIIKNPPKELLEKYHSKTKDIYIQISLLKMENFKLDNLKNNLLPLLINGQLEV